MGSWAEGMQANDTALDHIDEIKGLSKRKAYKAFEESVAWEYHDGARHLGVLGMADYLLDMEFGVPKNFLDRVDELVTHQLEEVEEWNSPKAREAALLRFRDRLWGIEVDEEALSKDNEGLISRMTSEAEGD